MTDTNTLLAKHFSEESTDAEELLVQQFKEENLKEYKTLKKVWLSEGLKVRSFDNDNAWKRIKADATKPPKKPGVIKLVIAAVALILLSLVAKHFMSPDSAPVQMIAQLGTADHQMIELADGSKVYLNEGAKFSYPKNFSSKHRKVTLEGEAYFDIARDESRPFSIKTNHSEVQVLGTSFNINTSDEKTDVSVTSGKVKVLAYHNNETQILIKDQAALVTSDKLESYNLENQNFLGWKTGVFSFKQQPIATVVEDLNSYYDNKFQLSNPDSECLLSANLSKNTLSEIVEIIELICQLSINQNNGIYELQ